MDSNLIQLSICPHELKVLEKALFSSIEDGLACIRSKHTTITNGKRVAEELLFPEEAEEALNEIDLLTDMLSRLATSKNNLLSYPR